jgi:hypothetical protein
VEAVKKLGYAGAKIQMMQAKTISHSEIRWSAKPRVDRMDLKVVRFSLHSISYQPREQKAELTFVNQGFAMI